MVIKYRDPETLSDSDEEFHPNIDTKSYRKYIKETREARFTELKAKPVLTEEEKKELAKLEYKFLPVDTDVSEGTFRMSGSETSKDCGSELVDDMLTICDNNTVGYFIEYAKKKSMNLEALEELVYINLAQAIKEKNDEWGIELCKVGLMARWMRDLGCGYMQKLKEDEKRVNEIVEEHYKLSQSVILGIKEL